MEKEEFRVYKDTRIFSKDGHSFSGALWEVSNLGSVRKNGDTYIPFEMKNGYLGFGSNYYVHRAVGELFIPNKENKPTIDHINRDKHDNRFCNLRWATQREQNKNRDNYTFSKSLIGKTFFGHRHSEESKAKMRAAKIGNKNTLGKVWVTNPTTEHSTMVNPSQLNDFLAKGYVRGMKQRNKEIMKS